MIEQDDSLDLNSTVNTIPSDTFNLSRFEITDESLLDSSLNITIDMAEQLELQLQQMNKLFASLKIPDVIKDLPEFHGDKDTLHEFISNVDEIIKLCQELLTEDQKIPTAFLRAIRNKIKGQANKDIFNYGTFTTWDKLKNDLITHYSDKRSEISLIRDLHSTLQGVNSTEHYYTNVLKIQTALINQVRLKDTDVKVKERLYKDMCLSQFIANLREPLGSTIRSRDPKTLPEAFELCTNEENMYYQKYRLPARIQPSCSNNPYIPQNRQNYQFRQNYFVRPAMSPIIPQNNWQYMPQRYQLTQPNYIRQPNTQNLKQITNNPPIIASPNQENQIFSQKNYLPKQIKQEKNTKLYNAEITEITNEELEIEHEKQNYVIPEDIEENQQDYYDDNEDFFHLQASE